MVILVLILIAHLFYHLPLSLTLCLFHSLTLVSLLFLIPLAVAISVVQLLKTIFKWHKMQWAKYFVKFYFHSLENSQRQECD